MHISKIPPKFSKKSRKYEPYLTAPVFMVRTTTLPDNLHVLTIVLAFKFVSLIRKHNIYHYTDTGSHTQYNAHTPDEIINTIFRLFVTLVFFLYITFEVNKIKTFYVVSFYILPFAYIIVVKK